MYLFYFLIILILLLFRSSKAFTNLVHIKMYKIILLIGVGCCAVLAFKSFYIREWTINNKYHETQCYLLDKTVWRRGPDYKGRVRYDNWLEVSYLVNTVFYRRQVLYEYDYTAPFSSSAQEQLDSYKVGETYSCWYDPSDPGTVVLHRGYNYMKIIPFIVLVILLICIK
jgi:hypothetical protein